jgi:hypothetical protein
MWWLCPINTRQELFRPSWQLLIPIIELLLVRSMLHIGIILRLGNSLLLAIKELIIMIVTSMIMLMVSMTLSMVMLMVSMTLSMVMMVVSMTLSMVMMMVSMTLSMVMMVVGLTFSIDMIIKIMVVVSVTLSIVGVCRVMAHNRIHCGWDTCVKKLT